MSAELPNFWNAEQEDYLYKMYSSMFCERPLTFEQKRQFWTFYMVQNKIKCFYSPNVEWTPEEKALSDVMLMEYWWLDSHNKINLNKLK